MSIDELAYYRKQQAKRPAAPIVCRTKINIPKFVMPEIVRTLTMEEFNLERSVKSRVSLFGAITTLQEIPDANRLPQSLVITLISLEAIKSIVAKHMNVTVMDLESKRRDRHVSDARKIYYMVAMKSTLKSTTQIGNAVRKDHSTVIKTIKSMQTYPDRFFDILTTVYAEIERWGRK
jgi:chromosomal replication initiation ATPase DnaA